MWWDGFRASTVAVVTSAGGLISGRAERLLHILYICPAGSCSWVCNLVHIQTIQILHEKVFQLCSCPAGSVKIHTSVAHWWVSGLSALWSHYHLVSDKSLFMVASLSMWCLKTGLEPVKHFGKILVANMVIQYKWFPYLYSFGTKEVYNFEV